MSDRENYPEKMLRDPDKVVDAFAEGGISRREFGIRMSALGFSALTISKLFFEVGPAAAAANSSLQGTVRMYKGPFITNEVQWMDAMIKGFNKLYPKIKVVIDEFNFTTVQAQATASFASSAHDIVYLPENIFAAFAPKGGPLLDLTTYINSPSFAATRKVIPPSLWASAKPHGAPLSAVPYVTQPNSMYFVNLDLMKKYGISASNSPGGVGVKGGWRTTYESIRAAAKKMTQDGNYGLAIRTNGLANFGWFDWYGYIRRAGGDILTKDWTKSDLDNPSVAAAIQMLSDIINKDKSMPPYGEYTWPALRDLFSGGRVGITHDEAGLNQVLTQNKAAFTWDVAQFPAPYGMWKNQWSLSISGMFTIDKTTKVPDQAWAVIEYWSSLPVVKAYFEAISFCAVRTDASTQMWKHNPVMRTVQNDFVPLEHGPLLHPKINQFVSIIQPLVDDCYQGNMTGAQAMHEAATQINALL